MTRTWGAVVWIHCDGPTTDGVGGQLIHVGHSNHPLSTRQGDGENVPAPFGLSIRAQWRCACIQHCPGPWEQDICPNSVARAARRKTSGRCARLFRAPSEPTSN